jgi:hypothetical protein
LQIWRLCGQSLAMGAMSSVVVTLLIGDQSPRPQAHPARAGQGDLQEQAHLGDAEWQGKVRVQGGHLIWRGQGTCGRGAQDPLSLVQALRPSNQEMMRYNYSGQLLQA